MFDVEKLKKESGLPPDLLERIEASIHEEFRDDSLLYELHVVRVLQALKEEWITLDEVLQDTVRA